MKQPYFLDQKTAMFPPSTLALEEPDGLLAIGGDLTPEWLLLAYSKGIFPWFNPGEPILWWTPNPRSVLFLEDLKVSKSLRKLIRQNKFKVTFDKAFTQVMASCASIERPDQEGTWITSGMRTSYMKLHELGYAHSVEVWYQDELVGGLYGVSLGKIFFGESMFSQMSNTSKIALVALSQYLTQNGFVLIDTQVETPHLNSLGAKHIPRTTFESILSKYTQVKSNDTSWRLDDNWFLNTLISAK